MNKQGNCHNHVEAVNPSSTLLRTIAYRAEPERYKTHPKLGAPRSKFSDDLVLSLIRAHRAGHSFHTLSAVNDIGVDTIKQWCSGVNRGHLLARVEREEQLAA